MSESVSVRVPASSANLGPGYDAFGLALALYDEYTAGLADEWSVSVEGEGAGRLAEGPGNLVARAMARGFDACGRPGAAASVGCVNGIPAGRGLGSSSAAIVGGLMLANELCGAPLGTAGLLTLATELEGHADNVGAALYGGFALCWHEDGAPRCVGLEPFAGAAVVLCVGESPLATTESRGLLPEVVPHADAAFNAGRAGIATAAVLLGRADLLRVGLADRLHEPYRISAVPDLPRLRDVLVSAGADGAALSGAGPTVMGIVLEEDDDAAFERAVAVAQRARAAVADLPGRREPFALHIDRLGARAVNRG